MKKSPCEKCYLESECCLMCNRWKAWFTRRWVEIQKAAFKKYGNELKVKEPNTVCRFEDREAQIERRNHHV